MKTPCANCPWRISNHGKRTPWGFYKLANLKRLWNGIRRGGPQSCHPTDPNHADHIAAGAKPGSEPQECPGSVVLVLRECEKIASYDNNTISPKSLDVYFKKHQDGLTRAGVMYWVIGRQQFAGVPFVGGPKLPKVDVSDVEIGRP